MYICINVRKIMCTLMNLKTIVNVKKSNIQYVKYMHEKR